jgi:hypothetical protein
MTKGLGIDRLRCCRDRTGELMCGGDREASIECRETMDATENDFCSVPGSSSKFGI